MPIRANSWTEKKIICGQRKPIRGQKRQKSRGIPRPFFVVVLVLLVDVVISSVLSCSLVVVSRVSFA